MFLVKLPSSNFPQAEQGFCFIGKDLLGLLKQKFVLLIGEHVASPQVVELVMGRTLQVPLGANGCACFSFEELCDKPLGAADYFGLFSNMWMTLFKREVILIYNACLSSLSQSFTITSLAQYLKPLTDIFDKLKDGKKIILVGNDFGGACISFVAELYPSKIAKAVFIAAAMLISSQSTFDMFSQQGLPPRSAVHPMRVNYVGKATNLYDSGYQLNVSAYVISKYISNTWLWDSVRVSGGAYGGFCNFDTHSGGFTFLSYRDPN
ncbi:hypothetical protein CRYUN_Cryun13aG0101500 [Craigia yunnanensis]